MKEIKNSKPKRTSDIDDPTELAVRVEELYEEIERKHNGNSERLLMLVQKKIDEIEDRMRSEFNEAHRSSCEELLGRISILELQITALEQVQSQ